MVTQVMNSALLELTCDIRSAIDKVKSLDVMSALGCGAIECTCCMTIIHVQLHVYMMIMSMM